MKIIIKTSCILLLIIGLSSLNLKVYSQTSKPVTKIRGILADSTNKAPLKFLTVTLFTSTDSIIKSELTKADGSFSFQNIRNGKYLLRFQGMGYAIKNLSLSVTDSMSNLGVVLLSGGSNTLNTVNVSVKKQLIKQEADYISYDLQADPQSKVSSVLDMMRKVPYLSVDGNENIMLRGSTSYRIFINGKPSGMVERNPKDILRSMPASSIKSIQVITNPSSKYDAEGLTGIINIITIKEVGNGYNGSINLNGRIPAGGPGIGGNFSYKQGKFGFSTLTGGSIYNTPSTFGTNNRISFGSDPSVLNQYTTSESDKKSAYYGLETSYEIDSLNLITAQFNISGSKATGNANQTSNTTEDTGILQQYILQNNRTGKGNGLDVAFNYQLGFKANKQQALTLSYRYLSYFNDQINDLKATETINYPIPDNHQLNDEQLSEHTVQIDYVQPLKPVTIEAGLKGIFRNNKSDFQYLALSAETNQFELDNSRSNIFNSSQNVLSFYNTYAYNTKKWQLKAGFRIEQTIIDGDVNQGSLQVKKKYLNVIPSIVINRKFKDLSSLSLSYSNRIQRPSIMQLNPFVDQSNPNFISTGNPDLKPTTSNAIYLSYLKSGKATINVSIGYLFFKSVIDRLSSYEQATGVTLSRFENTGKGRVYKTNIYISYPITNKWNISLNSDLRFVYFYATVDGVLLKNDGFMAYVNASSGYSFNKGWRVNADFTYNSGGVSGAQRKVNSFTASTFSVNKEIVKNKLSISAAIANPFNKYRYINEDTEASNFIQTTNSQSYYRSFSASVNYKFGRLKDAIRKNKRGINNDDLNK